MSTHYGTLGELLIWLSYYFLICNREKGIIGLIWKLIEKNMSRMVRTGPSTDESLSQIIYLITSIIFIIIPKKSFNRMLIGIQFLNVCKNK